MDEVGTNKRNLKNINNKKKTIKNPIVSKTYFKAHYKQNYELTIQSKSQISEILTKSIFP